MTILKHILQHVTVANLGDLNLSACSLDSLMESDIGHDSCYDCIVCKLSLLHTVESAHNKNMVAVDDVALFVHAEAAVSISIMSYSEISLVFQHSLLQ